MLSRYSPARLWSFRSLLLATLAATAPHAASPPSALGQQAYLKGLNSGRDDFLGQSVAASGDTVVVGAPREDSAATGVNGSSAGSESDSGAAYVFVRNGTAWTQEAYLKASNTEASDAFAWSVAISGDTIVVGAFQENSSSTGVNGPQESFLPAGLSGAAYVFVRVGGVWSQQAYLKASNTNAWDQFGFSVAVSGDLIVVGAPGEDSLATGVNGNEGNGAPASTGAAYVFRRTGTAWAQEAYLKAHNTGRDGFGGSVAVSGDHVVVGAVVEAGSATGVNGPDDDAAQDAGAAYVFHHDGVVWAQEAYLKASNTEAGDRFAQSLAIDGDSIVVGATHESSDANGVNGDESNNNKDRSGAAYVFRRDAGGWYQEAYLKAAVTDLYDSLGRAAAIAGDVILLGAFAESGGASGVNGDPNDNSANGSGAAYRFERNEATWAQTHYIKPFNTSPDDRFGYTVGASASTLVVGAYTEDGSTNTINGPIDDARFNTGAAYVFGAPVAQTLGRNAGPNPNSYVADAPVLGDPWTASVDLTTTGHDFASVRGTLAPAALSLRTGTVLLVGPPTLFDFPIEPGPLASWTVPIPNDPALGGAMLYTQAIHFGGVQPFALSNAIDLVLGF